MNYVTEYYIEDRPFGRNLIVQGDSRLLHVSVSTRAHAEMFVSTIVK